MNKIELQVGVKVLLKNKDGKYLLVRRNPDVYPEVGAKWDIVGGRIDRGISLFENLQREVKEETQLDLVKEPTLVAAQDILKVENRHIIRLTYIGEIDGEPILDEENIDYKWYDMTEIKELAESEPDKYFRELLQKGLIK